ARRRERPGAGEGRGHRLLQRRAGMVVEDGTVAAEELQPGADVHGVVVVAAPPRAPERLEREQRAGGCDDDDCGPDARIPRDRPWGPHGREYSGAPCTHRRSSSYRRAARCRKRRTRIRSITTTAR